MSDSVVIRPYCPGCEPETDPTRDLVEVRWCINIHPAPSMAGADDLLVTANALPGGSAEAGGYDNRRWGELVHREIPAEKEREKKKEERKRRKENNPSE